MSEKKYVVMTKQVVRTGIWDHKDDLLDYLSEKTKCDDVSVITSDWDVTGRYMIIEVECK
jgi:hypothetical protein